MHAGLGVALAIGISVAIVVTLAQFGDPAPPWHFAPSGDGGSRAAATPPREDTQIRDRGLMETLGRTVEYHGFNCGRVVVAHRALEDQYGANFLVACSAGGGPLGTTYRVTVQPRGTTMVHLW